MCDILEFVLGVLPDVLLDLDEGGDEGASVDPLGVGEPQDVGLFLPVEAVVDVDGVVDAVDDEVDAFPLGDVELGVGLLLAQLHVLQGGEGDAQFLVVLALLVLGRPVLALVGVAVVLSSLLDLVLRPLLVLHLQEDLLDFGALRLEVGGEVGCVGRGVRLAMRNFS